MGQINWRRVLLGGLIAGLVINLVEGVSAQLTMANWQEALAKHNLTMDMSAPMMAVYLLLGFVIGLVALWIYAGIRPRYGPGPKTAVRAGLAVWLTWYVPASFAWASLHLVPTRTLVWGALVGLVEVLVGTLLGAWVYRED